MDTKQAKQQFESSIKSLQTAVETLDSLVKPEGGLLSALSGRKEISLDEWNKIAENAQSALKTASKSTAVQRRLQTRKRTKSDTKLRQKH